MNNTNMAINNPNKLNLEIDENVFYSYVYLAALVDWVK